MITIVDLEISKETSGSVSLCNCAILSKDYLPKYMKVMD